MASKIICDRCVNEISGMGYQVSSGVKYKFDLCPECYKLFELFMKGGMVIPEVV